MTILQGAYTNESFDFCFCFRNQSFFSDILNSYHYPIFLTLTVILQYEESPFLILMAFQFENKA
jgi:hypothetical protein